MPSNRLLCFVNQFFDLIALLVVLFFRSNGIKIRVDLSVQFDLLLNSFEFRLHNVRFGLDLEFSFSMLLPFYPFDP